MTTLWRIVIWGLRGLALAIVLGLSALLLLGVWVMHTQHIKLLGVQTGSMVPAIGVGDALLVHPQNFSDLRVGQVISYRSDNAMIVSHRLRSIDRQARTVVTQGDHNAQPDSVVAASQIVGRVTAVMPKLGRLTDSLHQPLGLVAIIYLPATVCIVWQLRYLQERLKAPYQVPSRRTLRL